MDEGLQKIFMIEINQQSVIGMHAGLLVNKAVESGSTDEVWLAIAALLSAGGNISKILWPPRKPPRKALIERLSVDGDASPLAQRTLRNHFEHLDERIEQWWAESRDRAYVDTYVGAADALVGVDARDRFREYDPDTTVVTFRGDSVRLQDLVDEFGRLQELTEPPWFGMPPVGRADGGD